MKWYCLYQATVPCSFRGQRNVFALLMCHVLIQLNLFPKYDVLINEDTNLITQNNVLGYCAVFLANNQCQAAYCLAFLPSAFILVKDISLCFNHFMKKKLMEHEWRQTKSLAHGAAYKLRTLFCSLHHNQSEFTIQFP